MSQDHSEQHGARDAEQPSAEQAQVPLEENDPGQHSGPDSDRSSRPDTDTDVGADAEPRQAPAADELVQLREAMLRMRADMDNREKRLQREMERARKFATESLLRDLVPALDSMDQALATAAQVDGQHSGEGLELMRRQLLGVLEKHGLEVLDPVGEPFDPSWHEAMTTCPAEDLEPETVAQVLQKGYVLNERLIRPARVIVAK